MIEAMYKTVQKLENTQMYKKVEILIENSKEKKKKR